MTCPRCQIEFNSSHWGECPHCGEPRVEVAREELEGVVKTSTILISTEDGGVFRSMEEVPTRLRQTLVASTNGANSATIVIADQGGRARIVAALRNIPQESPTGVLETEGTPPRAPFWQKFSLHVAVLIFSAFAGALAWFLLYRLP